MRWLLQLAILSSLDISAATNPVKVQRDSKGSEDNTVLVSGEVVAVQDVPGEGTRATIKINRVYGGPKRLKGLALFDYTGNAGSAGNLAIPLLKVGEEGIWLMATDQNTDTLHVVSRYRKNFEKSYDRRIEWAEAYGGLSNLDVMKRLKRAQELCVHKTPEVAELGVGTLFLAKPDDAKRAGVSDFLKELLENRNASHSALVCADRLFEHRDGNKWIGSKQQKLLLSRLTEVLTDADAVEVAYHVTGVLYKVSPNESSLTPQEATAMLVKIATDPKQPKAVRQIMVERVVDVANNAGIKPDFTFEMLMGVVRSGTDAGTRLLAAKGIARFKWREPAQREALHKLLEGESDAEVRKSLQAALDASGKR